MRHDAGEGAGATVMPNQHDDSGVGVEPGHGSGAGSAGTADDRTPWVDGVHVQHAKIFHAVVFFNNNLGCTAAECARHRRVCVERHQFTIALKIDTEGSNVGPAYETADALHVDTDENLHVPDLGLLGEGHHSGDVACVQPGVNWVVHQRGIAVLSEAQKSAYARDGYLVIRGLLDAGEVAALRAAMAGLIAPLTPADRSPDLGFDPWQRLAPDQVPPGDVINPHRVIYMNDLHLQHARLDAHMRLARIADIFCGLWEADIGAFQSAAVIKPPGQDNEYHGWHQDMPDYVPLSNDRNGCIITYLHEMGPDTGGTSLVPGTHRSALDALPERTYSQVQGWPGKLQKRGIAGFDPDRADVVAPLFQPGDALVFHSSLYHRANSNADGSSKIGLINVYMAEDCVDLTERNQFRAGGVRVTRDGVPVQAAANPGPGPRVRKTGVPSSAWKS